MATPVQISPIVEWPPLPEERFRSLIANTPERLALANSILERRARGEALDLPSEFFDAGLDWSRTIKAIRAIHANSIAEAQAMVLAHPGWLRWCKLRVRSDRSCWKQAYRAALSNSHPDRLKLVDGQPVFLS